MSSTKYPDYSLATFHIRSTTEIDGAVSYTVEYKQKPGWCRIRRALFKPIATVVTLQCPHNYTVTVEERDSDAMSYSAQSLTLTPEKTDLSGYMTKIPMQYVEDHPYLYLRVKVRCPKAGTKRVAPTQHRVMVRAY